MITFICLTVDVHSLNEEEKLHGSVALESNVGEEDGVSMAALFLAEKEKEREIQPGH